MTPAVSINHKKQINKIAKANSLSPRGFVCFLLPYLADRLFIIDFTLKTDSKKNVKKI